MGPRGFRRRGRRRGLIVGAAVGSAAARRNNNNQQSYSEQPAQAEDAYAELEQLGQLHNEGILTDEEFQAKKDQLLGS
jgi:hypothetical protein